MKPSRWLSVFALIPLVLVFQSGCDHKSPVGPTAKQPHATVTVIQLNQPISFDELAQQTQRDNLTVEEIQVQVGDITCGYTVAGRPLASVRSDFFAKNQQFLSVLDTRSPLSAGEQQAVSALKNEPVVIRLVALRDAKTDAAEKLGGVVRDDIIVLPSNRTGNDEPEQSSPSPGPSIDSSYHERWAPYGGASVVTKTYTYQEFLFNNLSDYSSTRTYEQETQVYDKNFADFDGYWASNLPNAYKDTPFGDSIDNFTVGCSRGDNLRTYVRYWTYMSLRSGSASSATCKIRGQIGHRSPSWCYSTWCIWADATTFPGQLAALTIPNYGFSWVY